MIDIRLERINRRIRVINDRRDAGIFYPTDAEELETLNVQRFFLEEKQHE